MNEGNQLLLVWSLWIDNCLSWLQFLWNAFGLFTYSMGSKQSAM